MTKLVTEKDGKNRESESTENHQTGQYGNLSENASG